MCCVCTFYLGISANFVLEYLLAVMYVIRFNCFPFFPDKFLIFFSIFAGFLPILSNPSLVSFELFYSELIFYNSGQN